MFMCFYVCMYVCEYDVYLHREQFLLSPAYSALV